MQLGLELLAVGAAPQLGEELIVALKRAALAHEREVDEVLRERVVL